MNLLPVLSTLVSFLFAGIVFRRFLLKGGTHLAMWSFGLFLYGLGTLSEVVLSLEFSEAMLKLWYLSGAMLTAAWLGQGTFYLLVRRTRIVNGFTLGLLVASLLCILLIALSPLTSAAGSFQTALPVSAQYREILTRSGLITAMTIILNIYGTILLIGGAIYSAYLFWRKQVLLNRVIGNVFIAVGALSPALAGSFIKAGFVDILYISELVCVCLMLVGFQFAVAQRPAEAKVPSPAKN
jgi:hypothetical protein